MSNGSGFMYSNIVRENLNFYLSFPFQLYSERRLRFWDPAITIFAHHCKMNRLVQFLVDCDREMDTLHIAVVERVEEEVILLNKLIWSVMRKNSI
jgi:hypothetical protein